LINVWWMKSKHLRTQETKIH